MTQTYKNFPGMHALISQIAQGHVLYMAPLDTRPHSVVVRKYTIDLETLCKSKVTFWTKQTGQLTVNIAEHFDRFKRRAHEVNTRTA